jgi:S-adenosylmethionine:tRNA ribosyltransferase-isomerase
MNLSDFNYILPKELIAQYPSNKRDESRLLVVHRDSGRIEHRIFKNIVEYFNPEDLIILNDTKVVPSRLRGKKETGGNVEALVLPSLSPHWGEGGVRGNEYEVLLKPSRGCGAGRKLIFGDGRLNAVVTRIENGRRFLRFDCNGNFEEIMEEIGEMPLPPYIKRKPGQEDSDRYQTVFASKKGAVAAPTAGLHFTPDIFREFSSKGVGTEYVTLYVGPGTFVPVKCEDIKEHKMEKECFEIKESVIEKIKKCKGRVAAVGTTSCRVLETVFGPFNTLKGGIRHAGTQPSGCFFEPYTGRTDLFIYPSYEFKRVDALVTNFHLPKTTLLMLVSAFCGKGLLFKAYHEAVEKKYRFYSYGDAMLII